MGSLFGQLGGRLLGQAGGAISAVTGGRFGQSLRDVGGQLTGGFRAINLVPSTVRAAEPPPQVLPAQTQAPSTNLLNYASSFGQAQAPAPSGGGGGGGGAPPSGGGQGPTEQGPGQPDTSSIEALIQPALNELSNFEAQTRELLGGGEREAEAFRSAAETKATQAKKEGEAAVSTQQRQEEARAEGAVGEQRRGFAELAKGLRARFGSAISTGAGAESILGAETLRNIGKIRAGIAETVQQLNIRKEQLTDIFNSAVSESNFQAENLKQSARSQLQQALSQINARRGELLTRRADMVNQALQLYRQNVIDINARNTAFQQNVYQQKLATDEAIRAAQARASNIINNLETFSVQSGETKFIPAEKLGGEGALSGLEGTQLPGGVKFGTAGGFGVFSKPEQKGGVIDPITGEVIE